MIALLVFLIIVLRYLYYEYVFYYHKMTLEILYQNIYDWIYNLFRTLRERMKSKDLQTVVKNKYENGDGPTKIYHDLGGVVSLRTIKIWVQMLNKTGSIDLSHPPGRPTKANNSKVKYRLAHKKTVCTRRLTAEMNISRTSAQRILRNDLGCFSYKKIKQPRLTDLQKRKRVKFANWVLIYSIPKKTPKSGFFRMKNILIQMLSIMFKMTVCGRSVELKSIDKGARIRKPSFHQR